MNKYFTTMTRIAIYHNEDIHFEMLGFLIEYCLFLDVEIDIYCYFFMIPAGNSIIKWYHHFFNHQNKINWIYKPSVLLENDKPKHYDIMFLVSDSNPEYHIIQDFYYEKVITINHWLMNRCKKYCDEIFIRPYPEYNKCIDNYAFPCYNIFTLYEKQEEIKKQSRVKVIFIGRFNFPSSMTFSFFDNMDEIDFYIINYNIEKHYFQYLSKIPNVYFYDNIEWPELIDILKQSHFIFFNPSYIEGYCTHKTSASLHLAFSTLCIPIIPNSWNKHYEFTNSVIEYDDLEFLKPKKQLKISLKKFYELLPNLYQKRNSLISMRNRVIDSSIDYVYGTKINKKIQNNNENTLLQILLQTNIKLPSIYVETGVGKCETLCKFIPYFRELYGIELNKSIIVKNIQKYNDIKNIHFYHGFSEDILDNSQQFNNDCLFFLDSNFDENDLDSYYGKKESNGNSLLFELQVLTKRSWNDIIIFKNSSKYNFDIISKIYSKPFYFFQDKNYIILFPYYNYIPQNIFQICIKPFNKYNIPSFVKSNIQNKSNGFKYYLYDDEKIDNFLNNYGNEMIKTRYYNCVSAPHRKDIISLLLLYEYGGIYFDLDQEPVVDFNNLKNFHNTFVSCITVKKQDGICIGFIACSKHNIIIQQIIQEYFKTNFENDVLRDYVHFTKIAGNVVQNFLGVEELSEGEYKHDNQNIVLFQEVWDGPEDYKSCRAIYQNKVMFRMRYYDYPWNLYNS